MCHFFLKHGNTRFPDGTEVINRNIIVILIIILVTGIYKMLVIYRSGRLIDQSAVLTPYIGVLQTASESFIDCSLISVAKRTIHFFPGIGDVWWGSGIHDD